MHKEKSKKKVSFAERAATGRDERTGQGEAGEFETGAMALSWSPRDGCNQGQT